MVLFPHDLPFRAIRCVQLNTDFLIPLAYACVGQCKRRVYKTRRAHTLRTVGHSGVGQFLVGVATGEQQDDASMGLDGFTQLTVKVIVHLQIS